MMRHLMIAVLTSIAMGGSIALTQESEPPADAETAPDDSFVVPRDIEEADDDVFIPTEEVQAAEELTFPVDI